MKAVLDKIQGAEIVLFRDDATGAEIVEFTADMDIDCDGIGGNPHHDPYFQPETRLQHNGRSLHAEIVPFTVVPPVILRKTRGKVLGSRCEVTYRGKSAVAVVGDSGPLRKVGEGSPALAEELGLDPNPNHGGTSAFEVTYRIFVGVPAIVRGVQYQLQAA